MRSLSERQWSFLLKVARRVVPESEAMSAAEAHEFRAIIERALTGRPEAVRRQFALMLAVVRWAPALCFGVPLERLSPARQEAALRWFQDGPVGLLRKGLWGLKTLIFMGYYGRAEAAAAVGYRPSKSGNEELARRTES